MDTQFGFYGDEITGMTCETIQFNSMETNIVDVNLQSNYQTYNAEMVDQNNNTDNKICTDSHNYTTI